MYASESAPGAPFSQLVLVAQCHAILNDARSAWTSLKEALTTIARESNLSATTRNLVHEGLAEAQACLDDIAKDIRDVEAGRRDGFRAVEYADRDGTGGTLRSGLPPLPKGSPLSVRFRYALNSGLSESLRRENVWNTIRKETGISVAAQSVAREQYAQHRVWTEQWVSRLNRMEEIGGWDTLDRDGPHALEDKLRASGETSQHVEAFVALITKLMVLD